MSSSRWLAALLLVATLASPSASFAQAPPDSTVASAWGPIPARADSVIAREVPNERSAWEAPIDAVWWTVRLPFRVVLAGLRGTTVWLDESGSFERIKQFLAPLDLPYGFVFGGSSGRLSGLTGSLGFYHDAFLVEGGRFRATTSFSSVRNRRASGGFVLPMGGGGALEVGGGYRVRTRARFFGIGPGAIQGDEAFYTRELGWAGIGYRQGVGLPDTQFHADLLWSSTASRGPRDGGDLAVSERFADDLPTGFGRESQGLSYELSLVRNTTNQDGRPRGGGLQMLRATWFRPNADDEADFLHLRGEFQQFFDLWWDRSFAVRGFYSTIESDDPVHFQRLLTNDDPDLLRGFEDFRWRDRGMTALSVEYRWPIWDYRDPGAMTADAYTFYDGGQVFGDERQIALDNLTHSYGFGARMSFFGRFGGRIEVAFSDEDTVLRIRGDQMFQFGKDGLYHGRDPIPTR